MNDRVAVLIDGDNISPAHAPQILESARHLGRVDVARVYADATRPSGWLSLPGLVFVHAGTGKNAADLLLAVDAVELALAQGIETFVIASSDGDFSHLAFRLRERGRYVLGLGEQKAPPRFREACCRFDVVATGGQAAAVTLTATPANRCTKLDLDIRTMIATHSRDGRGMRIADLAPRMHAAHGTRISAHPERSWRGYLAKRPDLYDLDPRGPDAMVRFRPSGFAIVA